MSAARLTGLESLLAVIPLARALPLGAMIVTEREYAAVRLTDDTGLMGKAYCLSRNAPLGTIVDRMLAPHTLGSEIDDVRATWERMLRASAISGRVGLVRKAMGLVDIALWDLAAQRAGVPLWQLLGTGDRPRPTIMIASYPTPDRSVDEIVAEVRAVSDEGWSLLKISRTPDHAVMREILHRLNEALPATTELIVDVGFAWRDAEEALAEIDRWGDVRLAWLEDPLLPEDVAGCARIRDHGPHRIGVGDEVTDPSVLERLMGAGAVDVLRVDAVAIGGITPALEVVAEANRAGIPVSTHIYPEANVHLGTMVETFGRSGPRAGDYDPSAQLVVDGPAFSNGVTLPSGAPGIGFDLDWSRFPGAETNHLLRSGPSLL